MGTGELQQRVIQQSHRAVYRGYRQGVVWQVRRSQPQRGAGPRYKQRVDLHVRTVDKHPERAAAEAQVERVCRYRGCGACVAPGGAKYLQEVVWAGARHHRHHRHRMGVPQRRRTEMVHRQGGTTFFKEYCPVSRQRISPA